MGWRGGSWKGLDGIEKKRQEDGQPGSWSRGRGSNPDLTGEGRVQSPYTVWGGGHLDAVGIVIQQEDSRAGHFLGLHHGLQVSQEGHVLGHVRGQHLWARSCHRGHRSLAARCTDLGRASEVFTPHNQPPRPNSQRTPPPLGAFLSRTQTWPSPMPPCSKGDLSRSVPAPRPAHHVDDHLAQALPLALAEVLENVAVVFLQQLEAHGQVVILQHRLVIVHERQFRICSPGRVGQSGEGRTHPGRPPQAPPPAQQASPPWRATYWC